MTHIASLYGSMFAKSVVVWLIILASAVLNGALREGPLMRRLGQRGALLASGILLSLWIMLISLALIPRFGALTTAQSLSIGLTWVAMTVAFEFGFGRLVQHRDWKTMLEAYTFKDGNVWPLVLVVTFLAPFVAARLRGDIV
jgi:hypothetical protein